MAEGNTAILEYCSVSHWFDGPGGRTVSLKELSLRLDDAETLCLIGPSGCGKTTTLRVANRMVEARAGRIFFRGTDITELDPLALRRQMGYVPQNAQLLPHLTVLENVELLPQLTGIEASTRRSRAYELLELVNLSPDRFSERYPRSLSGGQQQRAAIARALSLDPPCLLMDEPFSALDVITRRQLGDEFLQMQQLVHKAILLVTHDLREAFRLGDRVALMGEGYVHQQGCKEDFLERPADDFTSEFIGSHELQ